MSKGNGILNLCRRCRVNTEKMWEEFYKLFPEIGKEWSETSYGAGLPQVPCLEVFPSGSVILCTWWQAKYIMNRVGKDLYVWLQRAPGSKGPWQEYAIGFHEADSLMVQMPDGSWDRYDL